MGGAGDPPAPVGDPPTGTAAGKVANTPCRLARTVAPVPSGESPDGTGGSPVLPANHFPNTLSGTSARSIETRGSAEGHCRAVGFWLSTDGMSLRTNEMRRLSRGCEAIACFVEEHVMVSRAAGWKDGEQVWCVSHFA